MTAPARCEFHPETPAVGSCSACGIGACVVCCNEINAATYCRACAVGREEQLPWLAAVFGVFAPGLGQVYNGEIGKGVAVFLLAPLVIPWFWGVLDAMSVAREISTGRRAARTVPTGWVLMAVKVAFVPLALAYLALIVSLGAAVVALLGWVA